MPIYISNIYLMVLLNHTTSICQDIGQISIDMYFNGMFDQRPHTLPYIG